MEQWGVSFDICIYLHPISKLHAWTSTKFTPHHTLIMLEISLFLCCEANLINVVWKKFEENHQRWFYASEHPLMVALGKTNLYSEFKILPLTCLEMHQIKINLKCATFGLLGASLQQEFVSVMNTRVCHICSKLVSLLWMSVDLKTKTKTKTKIRQTIWSAWHKCKMIPQNSKFFYSISIKL